MHNSKVAHAWAGQQKESARGSNFYFDGPSIYSYGSHFEIARHVHLKDGRAIVLFTTRSYSCSTSRHKSHVRNAIHGYNVLDVPRVDIGDYVTGNNGAHELNLRHFLERAKESHEKARKALAYGKIYGRDEVSYIQSAAEYLDLFRPKFQSKEARAVVNALRALIRKQKAGKLWTAVEMAILDARELRAKEAADNRAERRRRQNELREAQWALDNAARIEEARATLEQWTRGETDSIPGYSYEKHLPTKIRIKDKRIETSRGAAVTIRTAVELWKLMGAGTGDAAPVLGFDVDGFKVSAWDGETLTIGCHKLERAELLHVATFLGV